MRIAVDFDGTIVDNIYPGIGNEKPYAIQTLKQLVADGDEIILWTARTGEILQEAVKWCESRGLTFSAVNSNHHTCINHQNGFSGARKIRADIYIDDKNIGGFPGWPVVYAKITRLKKKIDREFPQKKRSKVSKIIDKISLSILSIRHARTSYSFKGRQ